ncbi:hypothetical protein CRYUN_Cryun22dG0119600 [Craigia yunnanensis]
MEPAKNVSQISHRLLLRDHILPDDDHSRHLIVERIIITIMVAMVILCLIALVIYKCFHRSNDSSNENPTEPKPSIDVELAAIPVLVFRSESTLPSSQPSCSDQISLELENCAICLENYVHGDKVRVLPRCKHMFHKSCIEEWLQVPSLHCPICRDQILEHCLQSARSNNCRNQGNGINNPFPSLAFNFGRIRYTPYPSVLGNFI